MPSLPTSEPGLEVVKRFVDLRKRMKVSAEKLAQTCTAQGFLMTRSTLANLESGRRSDISVGELVAIARALRTTPNVLLGEHGCPTCHDNPPKGFQCLSCHRLTMP